MAPSRLQSLLFAVIASWLLPFSIAGLFINYVVLTFAPGYRLRMRIRQAPGFKPKNILVTGVSSSYGLRVARAFHETGHNVVGAEYTSRYLPPYARFSVSVHKLYTLNQSPAELAKESFRLVLLESIDIWIDCSQNISPPAIADARRLVDQKTSCICFTPPDRLIEPFSSSRTFLELVRRSGLPVRDSHPVKSRNDIHGVLNQARGKKQYHLMATDKSAPVNPRTFLPRRTLSQTYNEVARIEIGADSQWVLEQSLDGLQRYQTFSIIAKGQIRAFAACKRVGSSGLGTLPPSLLWHAMLRCVQTISQDLPGDVNGHLCVDICVEERQTETGVDHHILPVEGRVVPDRTGLSFRGTEGSIDLVRAYLAPLSEVNGTFESPNSAAEHVEDKVSHPTPDVGRVDAMDYDFPPLFSLSLDLRRRKLAASTLLRNIADLLMHLAVGLETIYDFRDPLPFWYLYQIYIPSRFLVASLSSQKRKEFETDMRRLTT